MRGWILAVALLLVCSSMAFAEFPLDDKSTSDQILDALDARGHGLKDFAGDVALDETDSLSGDVSTLKGKVWFGDKGDGNSRIRVSFTSKTVNGKAAANYHKEYVLDNGWLVDRDYRQKIEVNRQVLKPGQKANLLKLGEGPFPLPIGQPREEVLKMFDVKRISAGKDDPAGTVHIELIPKEKTRFARKFKKLDVYVDVKTNFPRRISTIATGNDEEKATDLGQVNVNVGVKDADFKLEDVGNDWTRKTEPMDE